MRRFAGPISGYAYGDAGTSPVSFQDLENLKVSVGWTKEDERYRPMAGEVLSDRTKPLVDRWRRVIIASIPNLSCHSRTPDGQPHPDYQTKSGLRFERGFLITCFRPYDQDSLNYQHEITFPPRDRPRMTWKNCIEAGLSLSNYMLPFGLRLQ
jgi:hypothetical protein